MKTLLPFLLLLVAVTAHAGPCLSSEFSNVRAAPLHGASQCIMVISDRVDGPLWFSAEEQGRMDTLVHTPDAGGSKIDALSISPDDQLLAVVSIDEGHPLVDVFDLRALLARGTQNGATALRPLHTVDPYPGSIALAGWEGGRLIVRSDMPLQRLDRAGRKVLNTEPAPRMQTYSWDLSTDTFVAQ